MSKTTNERPCPCGSGTRHDECCGPIRRGPLERFTEEDLRQALSLATREVERPEYETWHKSAAQEFFGGWLDQYMDLDPDDDDDFDLYDAHTTALSTWLLFDRALDDGTRPIERMLERRGAKLLPGVRNALSSLCASHPQFLELVEIHEKAGFVVEDVFDGARMWISEPAAGEAEFAGDVLLARVFRDPRGVRSFLPDARCFPGEWKEHLVTTVTELREQPGFVGASGDTDFWKRLGPDLHEVWCEWAHSETEASTDPEIGVHRSTYRVLDAEAIAKRLEESPAFDTSEDGEWLWHSPDAPSPSGFGTLKIEGEELYLVALTPATHAELRAAAEAALAGLVEHVHSDFVDLSNPDSERETGS